MGIVTQAIAYGWSALAGIVLGGSDPFVVGNTNHLVQQNGVVQIVVGVTERCLATQTATNPVYWVDPPNFIGSVVTNGYTSSVMIVTNSEGVVRGTNYYVVGSTQVVTNCIGWYLDRDMLVTCDAKIQALCPYFINTNTLEALTFTGVLVSVGAGNGTNFTSVPAIGTNPATYGALPQHLYETNLIERYRVLNALVETKPTFTVVFSNLLKGGSEATYATAVAAYEASGWSPFTIPASGWRDRAGSGPWSLSRSKSVFTLPVFLGTTVAVERVQLQGWITNMHGYVVTSAVNYFWSTDVPTYMGWTNLIDLSYPPGTSFPVSVEYGNKEDTPPDPGHPDSPEWSDGWTLSDTRVLVRWKFLFCTNRYW